ncbi:hypothetical protein LQ384_09945 [Rhodococcus rhodochrous]|uniref:IF2 family translation initiation factor n=1 Tax=Rhodococcus rhodochrous TaxID=1829 RepID=A0AAW4XEM9_RHORH|nr:hypothetical protein [Rhodococcus rhodochrous]MCD2111417.1 hypothetical protein [Rhodococcus rhodochrous]
MGYSKYDEEHLNQVRAEDAQRIKTADEQSRSATLALHEARARSAREQEAQRLAEQAEVDSSIEAIIEAKRRRATEPQNEIDQLRLARAARPAPEDRRDVAADATVAARNAEAQRMDAEFARRTGVPSILDRMAVSVDAYRVEQARREERARFLRGDRRA